jgi:perosamine synthetase
MIFCMKPINQIEPWIDRKELKELKRVVKSTFVSEHNINKEFEELIKDITKSPHAVSMTNGTAALYCALKALGIGKGDEVIVPNLTFIASSNAVIFAGAKPVLCDVDKKSLCMSALEASKVLTPKTKAIMPVHLYGRSCDMDEICAFAKDNNLKIIEDAAQGTGVFYKNKHVGTFGDLGVLSFYANKTITCGEGGIILGKDKNLIDDCYKMKNHGRLSKGVFVHTDIGFNFSFTEMQAAVGVSQLKKLKKVISKKDKIHKFYHDNIKNNLLESIPVDDTIQPVHWFSSFLTDHKSELKQYLSLNKIQSREFFYPLNKQPCYIESDLVNTDVSFEVSEKIFKRGISLPSAHNITKRQLRYICKIINDFKV